VWIALTAEAGGALELRDLRPAQGLRGESTPFERALLRSRTFTAAAIDAPFSLPAPFVLHEHAALLRAVAALPCGKRAFPEGGDLLAACTPDLPQPRGAKLYRETERHWRDRRVNVRATTWNRPRGGAPFTAACLRLLSDCGSPLWPWVRDRPNALYARVRLTPRLAPRRPRTAARMNQ
jgi:hypothetical protein